jgi:uncharacterized membrane protein
MIRSPYAVLCAAIAIGLSARAETVTFVWHNGLVATQPYNSSQFLPGVDKSINDGGLVVGSIQDPATSLRTAATWNGSNSSSFGSLAGFPEGVANSINNAGSVVGGSIRAGSIEPTAWVNGTSVDLGILPEISGPYGVVGGLANTLNESGQIVGFQYSNSGVIPLLWQNGVPTELSKLRDGDSAEPRDINASGTIVGYSGSQPVIWQNGLISALPGCSNGNAYALNNIGQAVGYCGSDAVLWDLDGMKVIGPDVALGIDNNGTVIGRTSDNPLASQTFLWTAGDGMQVLPGFVWSQPFAISPNTGLIVGYGELAPEPSAVALAVAGGAILILIGWRRSRA